MISARRLTLSLLAWLAVGAFWLLATRGFHPSWDLAIVATGSLVVAYAGASYANHLILIPKYLRRGFVVKYCGALAALAMGFTALALAILRTYYIRAIGAGSVHSLELDYALDLFGMIVHLAGAAGVVRLFDRLSAARSRPS